MLLQEEMARLQQEIETLKAERAPGEKVSLKLALSAISHFLAGVWKRLCRERKVEMGRQVRTLLLQEPRYVLVPGREWRW